MHGIAVRGGGGGVRSINPRREMETQGRGDSSEALIDADVQIRLWQGLKGNKEGRCANMHLPPTHGHRFAGNSIIWHLYCSLL